MTPKSLFPGSLLRTILLLFFLMLLGIASPALAGEFCVGPLNAGTNPANPPWQVDLDGNGVNDGIIDGEDLATASFISTNNVTQITVDGDCTFRNWDPLRVTINFQTPSEGEKPVYLIVFDNVNFTGNMACANIPHKLWVVNSPVDDFSFQCQDLFIPVEAISKRVPPGKTTVGIGEIFTYTLTIPVLIDPVDGSLEIPVGSNNDLHSITVVDDLNATGVALTLQGVAVFLDGNPLTQGADYTLDTTNNVLTFDFDPLDTGNVIVPSPQQIQVDITVSVDNTNVIGTQFFNTASWEFGRVIELDPLDQDPPDGDTLPVFFDPLPGEDGVSEVLTIGAPDLIVTKSSPDTALNIGVPGSFTIDVQNNGNTDAWSPTIVDVLPDITIPNPPDPDLIAGMCDVIPSNITVGLFEADGTTPVPNQPVLGDDYTLSFVGPPSAELPPGNCDLNLVVDSTGSNNIVIEPGQRLIINYNAELDGDTDADGENLTNVAAATQWFSANPGGTPAFSTFNPGIDAGDPGTPGVIDNQDTHTVTTGLSGYFFTKSVENVSTGEFPATIAVPGDVLRYTLRVFNVDQNITNITITDVLGTTNFVGAPFNVSSTGVASDPFDPVTGTLTLTGNDLLNLGDELVYTFDIQLAGTLLNGAVVSNQAFLEAAGVADGFPNPGDPEVARSDDPFVNGIDDPLVNPPNPEPTDVTIIQVGPLLKVNDDPNTAPNDPITEATIGDEIVYTITVPQIPVAGPLFDVRITDDLTAAATGADLEFVSASVISGGSFTLSNTGTSNNLIIEDTGAGIDIPAGGQVEIALTVRVANTVNNQIGSTFDNAADYTYNRVNNSPGSQVSGASDSTAVSTVITEPDITTITKVANNITPTAGETVRYSVTLTAASGTNISDVFDVTLTDTLDLGLVYAGSPTVTTGSGVGSDNTITDPDVTGDGITVPQLLVWSTVEADIDIVAGETVTIEYDVLVLNDVLANQTLNNSVIAQWTGIDGLNSFERTGIDGAGGFLNDYATAPVIETLTTTNIVTTVDKVRSSDTFSAGDDNVRIGDIIDYTLTIPVPEGTLGNLQLVDTLPQGLDFTGVVSINGDVAAPYSAVAPFIHADIAAPQDTFNPTTGESTITWTLGDVTNPANDGLSDNFVIVYQAQVLNDDVLAQVDSTPLNNSVTMTYGTATGTVIDTDADTLVDVLQPNLTVDKSAAPADGDDFITAGEVITYTVDLINTGAAPVYDALLEDVIPVGLRDAGVTTTDITLFPTSTGAPVTTLASLAPGFNTTTGLASWDFDSGGADTYTIPAGETLRVVYTVTADADIAQGLVLTNAATATLYYSFDDEAVPAGAVDTDREIYGPSNTATTTLFTSAPPTKALISPAPGAAEATIGEEIVYQITVPGAVSASTLFDVAVTDTLDANLEILSIDVSGVAGVVDTSTGNEVNLAFAQIPAGQQALIELTTRVRNVLSAQQGVNIDNTVSYDYAFAPGGATQPVLNSNPVTVNIVEPNIGAISKTVDNLTPTAGETVRYSVQLAADGGTDFSDVFDVTITDTLDLGLIYAGNPTVTGPGNTIGAPAITGDGLTTPQTLVWSLADGSANITVAEGTAVTIEYDVQLDNGVLAGQVLGNSVVAEWTGIDGASGFERDGSDGVGGLNDYITDPPVSVAFNLPGINTTINKTRSNDTFNAADDNVRIGDVIEYTLTIPIPEGTLGNLQLVDTLQQGLEFSGVASINGDTGPAPFTAVAPFVHADISEPIVTGDPATGPPTTVTWNLGNVTNLPVDNADNDFVIVYRARVMDTVFAQVNSTPLNNTITMTYDNAGGTVTSSDLSTPVTLLQPDLTAGKSVVAAGGDTVVDAGEVVTYTVNLINNGAAPAYDPVLQDILPDGMRDAGVTTTSITRHTTATDALVATLANLAPSYNAASGLATWDFDSGGADTYTIPVGETLRIEYQVQTDADLGPGLTLTNAATITLYYSFDDDDAPTLGTVDGIREIYGPSNTDTTTLTTAAPVALLKETTQASAYIGEQFTYLITVPATPQTTALNDVRILDDLSITATGADLSFVSVAKISGVEPWTPENTGTGTSLLIEDTSIGIDIPAGDQAVIEITVILNNSATNVSGLVFNNTADYTFAVEQLPGLPGTSGDMTVVEPDTLVLNKSGPATMRVGIPETFTIDVQNTGTGIAWDMTIEDELPDPTPGGMCDTTPTVTSAQVFEANGTAAVSGLLSEGPDFVTSFSGEPNCLFTITMQSTDAAVGPTERLIINYQTNIDNDSIGGTSLTNIAAATEWFSGDTAGSGASGEVRTYTGTLSTGTVGTDDEQDAHTLVTEQAILEFYKTVINTRTGQDPGSDAVPGDTLQYTISLTNISSINIPDFSLVDELDALNSQALFEPGSLNITSLLPAGAVDNSDPNGGAQGSGLLQIDNLSLDVQGGANDSLTIVFEATLVSVIDSGTLVVNQVNLDTFGVTIASSDDPNIDGPDDPVLIGDEDPTETVITSSPSLVVEKISTDITGDPNVLLAGDSLRYTITVKNTGDENALNTVLSDQIPANTTYVANSTTLNGLAVNDPSAGESAIETGLLINAPENNTPGFMRADIDPGADNVAIITFDVVIDPSLFDGAVISNQGFVDAEGVGSGTFPQQPSDDPDTTLVDDPTLDVVGNSPLVDVVKTVSITGDGGTLGVVDPNDQLQYTITITNLGPIPATGVVLTDEVPANTSYVPNSVFLNGSPVAQPDGGISPLIAGIDISSSDLPPPTAGNGELSAGESATVIFDVTVDAAAVAGDIISNQGFVSNNELPTEPTDFDGIDSNGDQPTEVVVGNVQQLAITKEVFLVDGAATPGSELEYLIRVTNTGGIDATNVVITDNLDQPVADQMTYVSGSGLLDGLSAGVSFSDPVLTANYSAVYGALLPGEVAELRFRVQLDSALIVGTTITNIGEVSWSASGFTATASVDIDVGGVPGSTALNGLVWHDTDFDAVRDGGEALLSNWTVELYRDNSILSTTSTDTTGAFRFSGLAPNLAPGESGYELRYIAPGANATSATLGTASSIFTNAPQRITDIFAGSGSNLQNLNLPRQPNGIVYDAVSRLPVAGVQLTMINQTRSNQTVPPSCFDDPNHQNQLTLAEGYYKFDLNFSDPSSCAEGDEYEIQVQPPAAGFIGTTSVIIPPVNPVSGAAQNVPVCPGTAADQVPLTTQHCENSSSPVQPDPSIAPRTTGTNYYLKFLFDSTPSTDQIFNNHIPVDPQLDGAVAISKVAGLINVTRSQLVPYTITLTNSLGVPLFDLNVVDLFPAGFKYVSGSASVDGAATEPLVDGRMLTWTDINLNTDQVREIKLLLIPGSGVGEGEYVNTARAVNALTNGDASGLATATVSVVPDPNFDCTDIIGKVFDDKNLNGRQDDGEKGLAGVQVATARGLRVTTDKTGRFHITCAMIANEIRGSSFIMKVDDRTLPSGYRITTENPRVQRATRGKMMKFNFGATIHRVVRLDLANAVFEPDSTDLRPQWVSRIDMLLTALQKAPSILRLSYLAENESESEVEERLDSMSDLLITRWQKLDCCYKLTIEKEVFWRKGKPSDSLRFD